MGGILGVGRYDPLHAIIKTERCDITMTIDQKDDTCSFYINPHDVSKPLTKITSFDVIEPDLEKITRDFKAVLITSEEISKEDIMEVLRAVSSYTYKLVTIYNESIDIFRDPPFY